MGVGIGAQVVQPRRIFVGAGVGTDDGEFPVDVECHHRADALLARLGTDGVQQQQPGPFERAADLAAVGPEFRDDLVVPVVSHEIPSVRSTSCLPSTVPDATTWFCLNPNAGIAWLS
ncbi:hypothetical protein MCHIJ_52030 [Mycolicibacterium chitae]|nr:hypothetical protein MCHIJ_52030 [Mycolicibacterium chitae]